MWKNTHHVNKKVIEKTRVDEFKHHHGLDKSDKELIVNQNQSEKNSQIFAEYCAGIPVSQLAQKYGTEERTVYSILSKFPEYRAMTEQRNRQIQEEYRNGSSVQELSDKYNLTTGRIYRILYKDRDYVPHTNVHKYKERNQQIREEYAKGAPASELSKKYKIKLSAVQELVRKKKNPTPRFNKNRLMQRNTQIQEKYANGTSVQDLAQEYNISVNRIYRILHQSSDYISHQKATAEARHQNILAEHLNGATPNDIAEKFGYSVRYVKQILQTNEGGASLKSQQDKRDQQIRSEYTQGLSPQKLAEKYGIADDGIYKILKKEKAVHYSEKESGRRKKRNQEIIQQYTDGTTVNELAQRYALTNVSVYRILKQAGICLHYKENIKQRDNQIKKEYAAGTTISKLAKTYKFSTTNVRRILSSGTNCVPLRGYDAEKTRKRNKQLLDGYNNGDSIEKLAKKYGLSKNYVCDILRKMGVNSPKQKWLTKRNQQIKNEYANGTSVQTLAEKYNLKMKAVCQILDLDHNNSSSKDIKEKRKRRNLQIIEDYNKGVSVGELEEKYELSCARIYQIIQVMKGDKHYYYKSEQREQRNQKIWQDRMKGVSVHKLAEKYGLSDKNIYKIIKVISQNNKAGISDQ